MRIQKLKQKLIEHRNGFEVNIQKNGSFKAIPVIDNGEIIGVQVDNLGNNNFLTLKAFEAAIALLEVSPNHSAIKGKATEGYRLGSIELPIDSIEGYIAHTVYNIEVGCTVFRRITPIARILEWAEICVNGRGYMELK